MLSSVRTWLWRLFAVEDRLTQLNYSLGWAVQLRNNICSCWDVHSAARPSLWLQLHEDCTSSAGFLLSNLRVEILDPPCNKDPFLFDLSLTWAFEGLGVLQGLNKPMGERLLSVGNPSEMQSTGVQGAESCRSCLGSRGVTLMPGFWWGVDYKM